MCVDHAACKSGGGLILIMHKEEVVWRCFTQLLFLCTRIFLSAACDFTEYQTIVKQLISSRYYLAGVCSWVQHFQRGFLGLVSFRMNSFIFFSPPRPVLLHSCSSALGKQPFCLSSIWVVHPGPEPNPGCLSKSCAIPPFKKPQKGEIKRLW